MSPANRRYPHGSKDHCAEDQDRWANLFDLSEKVVLYWPGDADAPTGIVYYSTVSAANTAAAAAVTAAGAYPRVEINWSHSDITHISADGIRHPDAREDLPAWIDADPAH